MRRDGDNDTYARRKMIGAQFFSAHTKFNLLTCHAIADISKELQIRNNYQYRQKIMILTGSQPELVLKSAVSVKTCEGILKESREWEANCKGILKESINQATEYAKSVQLFETYLQSNPSVSCELSQC
jgi:hypothetical protein